MNASVVPNLSELVPAGPWPRAKVREVIGLEWARWTTDGREKRSLAGLSLAQKAGYQFEHKVGELLRKQFGAAVRCGPWIEFSDLNGLGLAQPDVLLCLPGQTIIFEAKRTYLPDAWDQLRKLYAPLVGRLRPVPVRCVQVCNHLMPCMQGESVVTELSELSDGVVWYLSKP